MMPMAEELLKLPLPRAETAFVREMLSGCQYFDARAFINELPVDGRLIQVDGFMRDLISSELPSPKICLQLQNDLAVLLADSFWDSNPDVRFDALTLVRYNGSIFPVFYSVFKDGRRFSAFDGFVNSFFINTENIDESIIPTLRLCHLALFALYAPDGFCHQVTRQPSRQARRSAALAGRPCHKWVEIRLGRSPAEKARARASGGGSGRGVAWHWRNGHPLNHPNPNQPKWRAGGWVGSPANGIRSHNYILDPDDGPAG